MRSEKHVIARFVTPIDGPERGNTYVLWPSGFRTYVPDVEVIDCLQRLGHVDPEDIQAVEIPGFVLDFYEELHPEYRVRPARAGVTLRV
jgi:hypothetical protein